VERRLAAILAADVVDYTRLMSEDQEGTLRVLRQLRKELFEPIVGEHKGAVVKRLGDGWIVEFPSISNAVACALRVHERLADHDGIRMRTGIHIGDVVFEEEDVFGDGVNVAARLEALAAPGEVLISDTAYQSLDGKAAGQFADGDVHKLKNVTRPIQVWRWPATTAAVAVATASSGDVPLDLPDKPSIAVLPFDNMSGDPDQEYFADGIAEDVITALSNFRSLFVVARNSSFSYKGRSPDIRTVARELGVQFVVEGSVRKSANRVRINAQLIEAATGNHIWAERIDGTLDDIFDLQDQITERIVVSVEPEIGANLRDHALRKAPTQLAAWDLYLRGLWHYYKINKSDNEKAKLYFKEAVELDPTFAAGHSAISLTCFLDILDHFGDDPEKSKNDGLFAAEKGVELDDKDSFTHFALGRFLSLIGEGSRAVAEMQKAVALNPNFAQGHYGLGFTLLWYGNAAQALAHLNIALRLSPKDPLRWMMIVVKAVSLCMISRYEEAAALAVKGTHEKPDQFWPWLMSAVVLVSAGRVEEARASIEKARQMEKDLSVTLYRNLIPHFHEEYLKLAINNLRMVDLPE
jgi:adenylate cyclase